MPEYQQGVCNINRDESKKRYISGGLGIFLAAVFTVVYEFSAQAWTFLPVFVFSVFGSIGIIQGRKNFCVAHAREGTQKTGEETKKIRDEEKLRADRKEALKTVLQALITGSLITASVYVLTLIV